MVVYVDHLGRQVMKERARKMRKQGHSIREIERETGVAKSTLSGWFRDIELKEEHKTQLHQNWLNGLKKARKKAVVAKKVAKNQRIKKIEDDAEKFVQGLGLDDSMLEVFLAGLYLGEGFKTRGALGFCNSNPKIVQSFLNLIRKLYNIDEAKLRVAVFGRNDQIANDLEAYWSELLTIPRVQFHRTQLDKRTKGTRSYKDYKGVCAVHYYDISLQRRIMAVSNEIIGRLAQLVRASH